MFINLFLTGYKFEITLSFVQCDFIVTRSNMLKYTSFLICAVVFGYTEAAFGS